LPSRPAPSDEEPQAGVDAIIGLLRRIGSLEEPNEDIGGLTILHHGLQCAAHLRHAHPEDTELQLAGLLHDVGHALAPGHDETHGAVGAAFVRPVLGERVAALIEAHVPAKRYLVTVDESYLGRLSTGSVRTLASQGATMTAAEVAAFRASPHAEDAVQLRVADEASKDPTAVVPDLAAWLPMLMSVAG
jgi:predicted HD phosphohydrolase